MKATSRGTVLVMNLFAAFCALSLVGCAPALRTSDATRVLPAPDNIPLEQHVDALMALPSSSAPSFSSDGKFLYFVSERGGEEQLYRHDLANGSRQPALPIWDKPVPGVSVSHDGRHLVFVTDTEGNELSHVFLADAASGQVRQATQRTLTRDPPILPAATPNTIYYSAREPGSGQAVVMRLVTAGTPDETEVYRDTSLGFLKDVSADGRRGLFLRFLSYQSAQLLLLDLDKGTAQLRYPTQGEATIRSAAFSHDGRRIYVATDGGTEQASVLALDTDSGKELARYDETAPRTATGEQLLVSPDGKRVAVSFNAGDHQVIRLLDADTLAPSTDVALPLGTGELGAFAPDGRQLALVWRTPAHRSSIYLLDTHAGNAARFDAGDGSEATAAQSTSTIETLVSQDGLRFPVIVTRPSAQGRHPVIVDFHGGPAGSSSIGWSLSASLANAYGIAYVQPNIRGSGGFGRGFEASDDGALRHESFKDVDALVDWLKAQAWVDPERLVVKGSSYGGYVVVQQLATHPGRWRAGVDQFGIVDFLSFMDSTTGLVRANYLREIGDPARDRALLMALSPINRVDAIRTPLFIYAGANDPRVPRAQSDMLAARVQANGVPVEYMLAENEGHGASLPSTQRELAIRSMRFVLDALDSPKPAAEKPRR